MSSSVNSALESKMACLGLIPRTSMQSSAARYLTMNLHFLVGLRLIPERITIQCVARLSAQ